MESQQFVGGQLLHLAGNPCRPCRPPGAVARCTSGRDWVLPISAPSLIADDSNPGDGKDRFLLADRLAVWPPSANSAAGRIARQVNNLVFSRVKTDSVTLNRYFKLLCDRLMFSYSGLLANSPTSLIAFDFRKLFFHLQSSLFAIF